MTKLVQILRGDRAKYWLREASQFFSYQIGLTIFNLASGLLIVRALDKVSYAYYTVAFVSMAMFTNITNAGIGPAINAIAGKHHEDPRSMGRLVRTALSFRQRIGLAVFLPVAAYALWQYRLLDAPWGLALGLIGIIGLAGYWQLHTAVTRVPLLFAKLVPKVQRADFWSATIKLAGIVVLYFVFPNILAFIAVTALGFGYAYWALARDANTIIVDEGDRDAGMRQQMVDLFKPNVIPTIYWSFQGQVTILLCSLFATTENVAELGALSKLTLAFGILSAFTGSYILPQISKAQEPSQVLKRSLGLIVAYATLAVGFVGLAAAFPNLFLWILGEKYYNLEPYLVLVVSVTLVSIIQNQIYGICSSRGWLRYYYLYTPITIATQVVLVLLLSLDDLGQIIIFDGVVVIVNLLLTAAMFAYEFITWRRKVRVATPDASMSPTKHPDR